MSVESLQLFLKVVQPAIADLSRLGLNLIEGARSMATASAELRAIFATAGDRLEEQTKRFAARDASYDITPVEK